MNMLSKTLLASATFAVMAVSANAAITYGASNAGEPYVGVKVGQVNPDVLGIDKKSTSYGVYGGYNFDQNIGVELEYMGSGEKSYNIGSAQYEYDTKAYGAYGTYRLNFNNTPFYAKGKLGVGKTEVSAKGVNHSYSGSSDKTGVGGGVAVGFKPTATTAIEAGYNYLTGDVNTITVGAHLSF